MKYWSKTPREKLETPWWRVPHVYIGFAVGILIVLFLIAAGLI